MSGLAKQLTKYLESVKATPFDWFGANCCHFGAAWEGSVTGKNPMDGLPATPGPRDALRLIASLGGSLASAWTRQSEADPILPALAQVGDIVLVPTDGACGSAIGICAGRTAVFRGDAGDLVSVDMSTATHAWRMVSPC